jgi:hypothetical protein
MCFSEIYSESRLGKYLSNMLSIQNGLKLGDAVFQLLFNFG